jgi:hypothetical protein
MDLAIPLYQRNELGATGPDVEFQKNNCDYWKALPRKSVGLWPKVLGSNVQRPENLEWRNFMFAREENETCNDENQTDCLDWQFLFQRSQYGIKQP